MPSTLPGGDMTASDARALVDCTWTLEYDMKSYDWESKVGAPYGVPYTVNMRISNDFRLYSYENALKSSIDLLNKHVKRSAFIYYPGYRRIFYSKPSDRQKVLGFNRKHDK